MIKVLAKLKQKKIKNKAEEQKGGFLTMLLGTLGGSLLASLSTGKGTVRVSESTIRTCQGF